MLKDDKKNGKRFVICLKTIKNGKCFITCLKTIKKRQMFSYMLKNDNKTENVLLYVQKR